MTEVRTILSVSETTPVFSILEVNPAIELKSKIPAFLNEVSESICFTYSGESFDKKTLLIVKLKTIFCIPRSPKIAGRFPGSDESQLAGELKGKKASLIIHQIDVLGEYLPSKTFAKKA